jgi:DNA-binding beta-propeller fold protein YncE
VTVINTANNTVVNTVNLGGSVGLTQIAPDGNHVFVETLDSSSVTVTMLDGRTGTTTGTPAQISGFPIGYLAFSGNRGYLTTISSTANSSTTTVTAIDAADNSIVGSTNFDGVADGGVVISPDGTKAAQATHDPYSGTASTLTLFDPRTGAVTDTPVSLDGWRDSYVPALFSRGGDRLSVITTVNGVQSRLVVVDTATAAVIASPITLAGYPGNIRQSEVFGPQSDLLYVASPYTDPNDGTAHTAVVVVDTTDGTTIGPPLVLDGNTVGTESFSVTPDRGRVFQTLVRDNGSAVSIIGTDGSLAVPAIPIPGYATRPVVFNADGSLAYQATRGINSIVTAIDPNTGSVIGNPVGVKGDWGDDILIGDGGNRIYDTTHITLFEFVIPLPGPWGFPIVFSLGSTHVNAIDTTAF